MIIEEIHGKSLRNVPNYESLVEKCVIGWALVRKRMIEGGTVAFITSDIQSDRFSISNYADYKEIRRFWSIDGSRYVLVLRGV